MIQPKPSSCEALSLESRSFAVLAVLVAISTQPLVGRATVTDNMGHATLSMSWHMASSVSRAAAAVSRGDRSADVLCADTATAQIHASGACAPLGPLSLRLTREWIRTPGEAGRAGPQAEAPSMITSHTPVSRVKLTLRDAVDRALGLHPEIRAALAVMEGASSEVEAAKGGYYPSLQIASGPENRFRGGWGYDVTVSQVLYDWGGTDSLVASAQAAQRKLTESTQEKRSDVSLDVIELSVDLLTAGQQMEVTSRYHGHLQSLRELIQDRVRAGYSDSSELNRVLQAIGFSQEQSAIERGKWQDAREQLGLLLDLASRDVSVELPPHPDFTARVVASDVLSQHIVRSPRYRQAEEELAASQAVLDTAKAALNPRVQLEASSLRREVGGTMTKDSVLALRLRMDVLQGLSGFHRADAEVKRVESARWAVDAVRRDLHRRVNSLRESEAALSARLSALDVQVAQFGATRSSYRDQFVAGLRNIDDLIRIEREGYDAERQRISTLSEYWRIPYRAAAQLGLLQQVLEGRMHEVIRP